MKKITEMQMRSGKMAVSESSEPPFSCDTVFRLMGCLEHFYNTPEGCNQVCNFLDDTSSKYSNTSMKSSFPDSGLHICLLKDQHGFILEHRVRE